MFSSLRQPFKSSWILVIVILHFVNSVTQDNKDEQVTSPSSTRLPLDTERRIAALPVDTLSPESKLNNSNWKWRSVLYNASPRIQSASTVDTALQEENNGGEDLGGDYINNNDSSNDPPPSHDSKSLQNLQLDGQMQGVEEVEDQPASSQDWGGKLINNTNEIRDLSSRNRRELIVLRPGEEEQEGNYNENQEGNIKRRHNAQLPHDAQIPFSTILRADEGLQEGANQAEHEVEEATNKIADIELFKLGKRKEEDENLEGGDRVIEENTQENQQAQKRIVKGRGSGPSSVKFHFQHEEMFQENQDDSSSDPLEVIPLSDSEDDSNPSETLRIIPQLVNVTTENVYVSLESEDEEEVEGKLFKNHLSTFDSSPKNRDSLEEYPGIRLPDNGSPPVITVNSSGIFPLDVLPPGSRGHHYISGMRGDDIFSSFSENLGNSNTSTTVAPPSWGNKIRKLRNKPSSLNESLEGIQIIDQLDQAFQEEEPGEGVLEGEDGDGEEGGSEAGKTLMMRRRPRRSVVHLYDMVVCATGCNPLIYKGYGCFCGFMGSGLTVDGIDKCCFKHDWCYHHAKCPPLLTYFVPYYWTCNAGRPKCVSDFRGWQGICGAHLCECDRQFAECLKKYPCPRSRAMCMTSPWRMKSPPPLQANYELIPVRPVRIDRD